LSTPVPTENEVFIVERINEGLDVSNENGDIVLEGTAAVFGVKNNNNRVYEKEEYLPHLSYTAGKNFKGSAFRRT